MSTLDLMRQASKGALAAVRGAVGVQSNPMLQIYEKMVPEDFVTLAQKHGQEFVTKFITDAEALRMRGGK